MYEKKSNRINLAAAMVVSSCACGGNSGSGTTGGSSASGNSGASAESGAAEGSGVITDNFCQCGYKWNTVTFWHSMGGVNGEAMDYLVNKFNEENTDGITVEAVYQANMTIQSIN